MIAFDVGIYSRLQTEWVRGVSQSADSAVSVSETVAA